MIVFVYLKSFDVVIVAYDDGQRFLFSFPVQVKSTPYARKLQ